jgi:hypothetical protein
MNLVEKHVVLFMQGGQWGDNVALYLRVKSMPFLRAPSVHTLPGKRRILLLCFHHWGVQLPLVQEEKRNWLSVLMVKIFNLFHRSVILKEITHVTNTILRREAFDIARKRRPGEEDDLQHLPAYSILVEMIG